MSLRGQVDLDQQVPWAGEVGGQALPLLLPAGREVDAEPGGGALASAAVTVSVDQPAGSAADGLLSASTDLKPVGVSATRHRDRA